MNRTTETVEVEKTDSPPLKISLRLINEEELGQSYEKDDWVALVSTEEAISDRLPPSSTRTREHQHKRTYQRVSPAVCTHFSKSFSALFAGEMHRRAHHGCMEAAAKERRAQSHLRYTLVRNGSVSFVRVEKSSGDQSFDDSAVQAVRRASPFPAPPKSFPIGDLRMALDPTLPVAPEQPKPTPRQQQPR